MCLLPKGFYMCIGVKYQPFFQKNDEGGAEAVNQEMRLQYTMYAHPVYSKVTTNFTVSSVSCNFHHT